MRQHHDDTDLLLDEQSTDHHHHHDETCTPHDRRGGRGRMRRGAGRPGFSDSEGFGLGFVPGFGPHAGFGPRMSRDDDPIDDGRDGRADDGHDSHGGRDGGRGEGRGRGGRGGRGGYGRGGFGPGGPGGFGPGGPRGPFGPEGPEGPEDDPDGFGPHGPHGHGGGRGRGGRGGRGRGRRPRGDVRTAVLLLLSEEPMHGYQLMQSIGERTQGRWSPSPGAIYPTISQLEDEGLVETSKEGGRKLATLTEAGRAHVEEHSGSWSDPFAAAGDEGEQLPDVRVALQDLGGAVREAARSADAAQLTQVVEILGDARRSIYRVLAGDAPSAQASASASPSTSASTSTSPSPSASASASAEDPADAPAEPREQQ